MHFAMAASHLELKVQHTSQGTVFSEENLYNTAQPEKEITTVECAYRRKVRKLWITRPIKQTVQVQASVGRGRKVITSLRTLTTKCFPSYPGLQSKPQRKAEAEAEIDR